MAEKALGATQASGEIVQQPAALITERGEFLLYQTGDLPGAATCKPYLQVRKSRQMQAIHNLKPLSGSRAACDWWRFDDSHRG